MTTLLNLSFGLLSSLSLGGFNLGPPPLDVGIAAPQFAVEDVDGNTQDLEKLVHNGPVVLVFFPEANSPYCTQELQSFVSRAAELKGLGAQVLAISNDKVANMRAFRDDLKANFPFIADGKALIAGRYNAKMPIVPRTRRRTYIIDRTMHVAFVEIEEDAIALKGVVEALAAMPH